MFLQRHTAPCVSSRLHKAVSLLQIRNQGRSEKISLHNVGSQKATFRVLTHWSVIQGTHFSGRLAVKVLSLFFFFWSIHNINKYLVFLAISCSLKLNFLFFYFFSLSSLIAFKRMCKKLGKRFPFPPKVKGHALSISVLLMRAFKTQRKESPVWTM